MTCIAIGNLHKGRIISWYALTNGAFCFGNTLKMLVQIRIFRDQPKMINRSCVNLACSCGNQATFLVDCCCWSFPVRSTYTSAVQQTQDQLKHDGVVVVSVVNVEARDNRYVSSGMLGETGGASPRVRPERQWIDYDFQLWIIISKGMPNAYLSR